MKQQNNMSIAGDTAQGHIAALFTILIWGTTYVSTKFLLESFQPIEILFIRFVMGFFLLLLICPKRLKTEKNCEWLFVLAGFLGITVYYLFENIALVYTQATNVGVIISVAPFFTALASRLILKEGKITKFFILGFLIAMIGIVLISYPENQSFKFNPIGDLLSFLAAAVWAGYSVVTRKISQFGYNSILVTRRTFFYGIMFMIPAMLFLGYSPDYSKLADPGVLANMLFLGLGASAVCFVTWNIAVKKLGAVRTSVYIYLAPVITSVSAIIFLKEYIGKLGLIGILFTVGGLFLSQKKVNNKDETVFEKAAEEVESN